MLKGADRKEYITYLAKEIKNIDDGIVQNDLVRIISSKLMIEEKEFIRTIKTQRIVGNYKNKEKVIEEKAIVFTSKIEKAQVELIKLMFSSDELTIKYVKQHVKSDLITIPFLKKIL